MAMLLDEMFEAIDSQGSKSLIIELSTKNEKELKTELVRKLNSRNILKSI